LCAAQHLLSRPETFAPPVVFEMTERVGGTWVYEERTGVYDNGWPIHSSMYRDLRTNLPKEVMMFPDFPFDPKLPSFLSHRDVLQYLERYCEHFDPFLCQFGTMVEEVKPITVMTGEGKTTWEVTSCAASGGRRTDTFDSVFICNGLGLQTIFVVMEGAWKYPVVLGILKGVLHNVMKILPSLGSAEDLKRLSGQLGISGIWFLVSLVSVQVILSHGNTPIKCLFPTGVHQAPPISKVLENGELQFLDGSLAHPQVLLFCTGYKFNYPFLDTNILGLQIQDHWISPLYKFLVPPAFPSLFIVGICKIICPFPHFDCQVRFALAVLDGTITLPSQADMEEQIERETEERIKEGLELNQLTMKSRQWKYYQMLANMAGFKPPPPVTRSLLEEVMSQRQKHPRQYREFNYRIVNDTQWELLEVQDSDRSRD
uniref:Flavin-containing monooxygenase n=1 Tax=Scleropages formosus TaxID=113540 RepID=A0A8C9WK47_SCLFO